MRFKKQPKGKLSATVPLSYWCCLSCSIFTPAPRIFAMILRWQHQLLLICIVTLGLHTENISDYGLAVQIDGGPRRGDAGWQTRLWWKWAPWRSGTAVFTPPRDSLETNFQLSFFFCFLLPFGICPSLSTRQVAHCWSRHGLDMAERHFGFIWVRYRKSKGDLRVIT